jgi:hypothetical protein
MSGPAVRSAAVLIIRERQMGVFRAEAVKAFEDRMVQFISDAMPGDYARLTAGADGDTQVRAIVRAAVTKAKRFGIEREGDIEQYVLIAAHAGTADFENADATAWTGPILRQASLTGPMKMALLWERLDPTAPLR